MTILSSEIAHQRVEYMEKNIQTGFFQRRAFVPLRALHDRRVSTMPAQRGDDARREQLLEVAIDALADCGLAGSTLAQIAGRADVSPGLIAHYFGDKDGLLEAAFRRLTRRVQAAVRLKLLDTRTPRERVLAIVDAHLAAEEFNPRTANAWLAFWGGVRQAPRLRRVQAAYQRRMLSNLRHALQQLMPAAEARQLAAMIAAMIDGVWLRAALSDWKEADSAAAQRLLADFIDGRLQGRTSKL
jgi:betaine-aldehyde dehydrogenase